MFADTEVFNGFAADDLEKARQFYGETLGVRAEPMNDENTLLALKHPDGRDTLIYLKPDYVPATYTVLNFRVDDIEAVVDQLAERGVATERYEEFEQDEKGILREGDAPPIAWFKDPAGNILAAIAEQ
jgi:predicted enzyme related to lactoylglutathione lyase